MEFPKFLNSHKKNQLFDLLCFFFFFLLLFLYIFVPVLFFNIFFPRYGLVWLLRKWREGEFWGFRYQLCGTRNDEEFQIFLICFNSYIFSDPNKDNPWFSLCALILPHSIPQKGKTKNSNRCKNGVGVGEERKRAKCKQRGKVHSSSNE